MDEVPGGYMVKSIQAELKFMAAFSTAEVQRCIPQLKYSFLLCLSLILRNIMFFPLPCALSLCH